jgi:hypothetical protein
MKALMMGVSSDEVGAVLHLLVGRRQPLSICTP